MDDTHGQSITYGCFHWAAYFVCSLRILGKAKFSNEIQNPKSILTYKY